MNNAPRLIDWLDRFDDVHVLCVGDVMLDRFVYGDVERISPEAPIPVLRIAREALAVGGAGNVARNLSALGARVRLVGVVGDDEAGRATAGVLESDENIDLALVRDGARPTTVKTRFIAGAQQMLRTDEEDSRPIADDVLEGVFSEVARALAGGTFAALVLSDYGKGVLTDDVIARTIAAASEAGVPVIVDPKGVDFARYAGATLLTPNRRELADATRMDTASDDEAETACRALMDSCAVSAVIATRGSQGMTVAGDGAPVHLPALAREVFDVSGAGDTVVATLAAGLGAGMALVDAAQLANVAAGIVVGKVGTAVVRRDELSDSLGGGPGLGGKLLSRDDLADRVSQWRARGLAVGFTNGCFDIVHPGHISLVEQASAACDRLIVALNDDASVARLKGEGRPIQPEDARARVMASLAGVDAVVLFAEDTPEALIEAVRPDVLIKGADYKPDEVVGGPFVESYGGKVVLANLVDGFSTTGTIARMTG